MGAGKWGRGKPAKGRQRCTKFRENELWEDTRSRGASESLRDSSLFQDAVCREAGLDGTVNDEMPIRNWAVPDFMVPSALPLPAAAVFPQDPFQSRGEGPAHS